MIHTANTVRTLQAVAMTVGISILLWSTGLPTLFRFAEASSITNASDTLSNSAPSLPSNHTIEFETETDMTSGQTIAITFPAGFTLGSVGEDDTDILFNGISTTTAAAAAADTWGVAVSGQIVTFTSPTNYGLASNTPVVIRIGNNADDFGTGVNQISNPAGTTSYVISIGGTMPDSGEVRVAIVDQVVVSASVDTSLTFTVTGVGSAQSVNGTTTTGVSTNTTLPFNTLNIGEIETLAHDLAVTTNAAAGYTVTVEQTGNLQSSTGATIDGFIDGDDTASPTAWVPPSALIADNDTFGHWGLTSNDGTTTRLLADEFGSNEWVSGSTTPVVVMGHDGPSDGTTSGVGLARVGYQVQISALQEAGDDYTTTLRYIATPTF